jgi:hypothetical protein
MQAAYSFLSTTQSGCAWSTMTCRPHRIPSSGTTRTAIASQSPAIHAGFLACIVLQPSCSSSEVMPFSRPTYHHTSGPRRPSNRTALLYGRLTPTAIASEAPAIDPNVLAWRILQPCSFSSWICPSAGPQTTGENPPIAPCRAPQHGKDDIIHVADSLYFSSKIGWR